MKAYFPHVQVSYKNLNRKKEVKPGERVTANRAVALQELVLIRTSKRHAGALLVVEVPEDRARSFFGDWFTLKRLPLKVSARERPSNDEYKVAAVEVLMDGRKIRNMETDIRTGEIIQRP